MQSLALQLGQFLHTGSLSGACFSNEEHRLLHLERDTYLLHQSEGRCGVHKRLKAIVVQAEILGSPPGHRLASAEEVGLFVDAMISCVLGDPVQKLLWIDLSLVVTLAHGVVGVRDKREDQVGLDLLVVDVGQKGIDDLQ